MIGEEKIMPEPKNNPPDAGFLVLNVRSGDGTASIEDKRNTLAINSGTVHSDHHYQVSGTSS